MKNILVKASFWVLCVSLITLSCRKERDYSTAEGEEAVLFERIGDDNFAIMEQASTGKLAQYGSCATITHDTLSTPRTLTVDFGSANCLCADGKQRRGKMITTYTGAFNQAGTVRTTTYEKFFINNQELKGKQIVTHNGLNTSGNPSWTIDTKDTLIIDSVNRIMYQSMRTREQIAGANTPMWADDKYSLKGSGSGIRREMFNYSMTITKELIIDHNCLFRITSGTMKYQPQGKALRSLDYGDGACDNDATVTINNKAINIKFK